MSVDYSGFAAERRRLEKLVADMPKIMNQLTVGEGVNAVAQARRICKEEDVINNGTYRENFHTGSRAAGFSGGKEHDGTPARRRGDTYLVDVYNSLDYAQHLEYGFRSHFVPGHWEGHTFVYQSGFPGGMYVGPYRGFVPGHFTLRRALRRRQQTANGRLARKFDRILGQYLNGKGGGGNDAE